MLKTTCMAIPVLCLAACATQYAGPAKDVPRAYVRFTDDGGPNIRTVLGGRTSEVVFYDKPQCEARTTISSTDWIPVPANTELGFTQFFNNYGSGSLVQARCYVSSKLRLKEGQRVELKYYLEFGGGGRCRVEATDMTSAGDAVKISLQRFEVPECKS